MADEDSGSIYFRGRVTARKRKQRQFEAEQYDDTKRRWRENEKKSEKSSQQR